MPAFNSFFTPRIRRTGIAMGIVLAVVLVLLFVVISPLAKYLIQKYDEKLLGRNVELSWVYVNPLTGYVFLKNVRVYEHKSDTLFFKADGISADFSMLKLFKKTYEISSLSVCRPWGHVVLKSDKRINFKDIIDHFSPKDGTIVVNKERVRFSILDCTLEEGQFQYDDVSIPVTYFVKHVNVQSPGKSWDMDTMRFNIDCESGPTSGILNGYFSVNYKTNDYRFGADVDSFDLKPLSQYMRQLSNYGTFGGILNTRVTGQGNFRSKYFRTAGLISINLFYFGPSVHEQYGSFQKLVVDIIDADPDGKKYRIDSILLDRPYFRYEKYDSLDNLALMFWKKGQKPGTGGAQFNLIIEIARYLQEAFLNFAKSDYKINKFTVHKGNFVFTDFSLYEKFSIDAMPVHIRADSIDKTRSRVKVSSTIKVRPYGDMHLNASLDPKNLGTFDIDYGITKVPVSMFNPYLLTYTSFPLNRGTLSLTGHWNVVDSVISSTNHLLIIGPRVGKKMKDRDTKRIPMPLIMSLARDAGEVIDYEIPVRGDLKKPEFVLKHVIWDVVRNIFVKPPMTPYLVRVKRLNHTIEKMLAVDWEARQISLSPEEDKFVNTIARFLKRYPENNITVSPLVYAAKEKEHIAFYEGKKKYFLSTRSKGYKWSEEDSLTIEQMSTKDTLFVRYLDKRTVDSMMFSPEQKCRYLVGDDVIEARLNRLNAARKKYFLTPFVENGTASQIKFAATESGVPFNGFSNYKLNYHGDVPEPLLKANEKISEMNEQAPRKKHRKRR